MTDGTRDAAFAAARVPAARMAGRTGVPPLVFLFLVTAVLVPVELGFFLGSLFFTWSKALLVVVAIPVLIRAAGELRLTVYDGLFVAHTVWVGICTVLNKGPSGIETAGTYFLEFTVVYLMVRLQLQSLAQVRATVRMLFWLVAICALVAIPEALLKERFIHDWASSMTGITYRFSDEERLGFLRAASFFEHPILHGLFCAFVFSLMWFTEPGAATRILKTPLIALGAFFALSSAPLLVLATQMGLVGVERTTRWLPRRLMVITAAVLALVGFLNVATGRGAFGILTMFTLDSGTAWYRTAIWENGLRDVWRSPIIGILPETWSRLPWMSVSIDNHWLLMAFMGGLPGLFLFFGTLWTIWRAMTRSQAENRPPLHARLSLGWGIMVIALLLGGATVAYFGRMQPLLAFYIALGAAVAANRERTGRAAPQDAAARPVRRTIL